MNAVKKSDNSLLQKTYVQKSKLFLLPLTGIKRDAIMRPTNSYVSSPDLICDVYPYGISRSDYILVVNFSKSYKIDSDKLSKSTERKLKYTQEVSNSWDNFELDYILSNPAFIKMHETEDEYIYTFDMSDWKYEWNSFLAGRYSQFSKTAKDRILRYRWNDLKNSERNKMHCYLYPNKEECLRIFADDLKVSIEDLREVKELCSKPDFKLEMFRCELIKKTEGEIKQ